MILDFSHLTALLERPTQLRREASSNSKQQEAIRTALSYKDQKQNSMSHHYRSLHELNPTVEDTADDNGVSVLKAIDRHELIFWLVWAFQSTPTRRCQAYLHIDQNHTRTGFSGSRWERDAGEKEKKGLEKPDTFCKGLRVDNGLVRKGNMLWVPMSLNPQVWQSTMHCLQVLCQPSGILTFFACEINPYGIQWMRGSSRFSRTECDRIRWARMKKMSFRRKELRWRSKMNLLQPFSLRTCIMSSGSKRKRMAGDKIPTEGDFGQWFVGGDGKV